MSIDIGKDSLFVSESFRDSFNKVLSDSKIELSESLLNSVRSTKIAIANSVFVPANTIILEQFKKFASPTEKYDIRARDMYELKVLSEKNDMYNPKVLKG